jgi:16S rRNA (adenine1518-N6/adenine1519-N6)-dimethyltransferase
MNSKAKKSLGQNFLTNENEIKNIVSALNPKDGEVILEIGPGHGELTKEIKKRGSKIKIIAIEKDGGLAGLLRERFKNHTDTEIISGDALRVIPGLVSGRSPQVTHYKLIGNIPYYITGFLLRTLGELGNKPGTAVLTVQREVAERICARPPKMNILAASVRFWAEPETLGVISKNDFRPKPRVDSAVIKLTTKKNRPTTREAKKYYGFIRVLFKQPRKTTLNNLSFFTKSRRIAEEKLKKIGVDPTIRPQNMGISEIRRLAGEFSD